MDFAASTFVMDRFWWDQAKADETLLPVMRKLAEREVGCTPGHG